MISIDLEWIETELPKLLAREFDMELLKAKAEVNVNQEERGASISITPFDDHHASVYIFYENAGAIVYLTVGQNTVLEVPIKGHGYTDKSDEDELLSILHAAINRGFEETVWEIDGNIVRSEAELIIAGEANPLKIISSSLYNPFRKKKVIVKRYVPYY